MADLDLSRWYYPPGRPLEDGRVFARPELVPQGWSTDPSPPVEDETPKPVISHEDYAQAVETAQMLAAKLAEADARIAELEAQVAAKGGKKAKASADPAPADAPATDTPADGK